MARRALNQRQRRLVNKGVEKYAMKNLVPLRGLTTDELAACFSVRIFSARSFGAAALRRAVPALKAIEPILCPPALPVHAIFLLRETHLSPFGMCELQDEPPSAM